MEALLLKTFRNLGPMYYQRARFARREIPWRDKWAHATQREYEQFIDALNPPDYQKASQHKVLEKATLTLLGLPTPRFLAFFHPQRGQDGQGAWLRSCTDLAAFLQALDGQRVCFKQVEGFGGSGFMALDVRDGGSVLQHPVDGKQTSVEAWYAQLCADEAGWLIEAYMPQHPAMALFNSSSVNTLRLWVLDAHGGPRITHALVRVGRAGDQVDNTTRGGLALPIQMDSGLTLSGPDLKHPGQWQTHHPDSGVCLVGLPIPHWHEAQALAVRALQAFPRMRFAGLDIAIGVDGPMVIELNVQPDRISALRWDLPLRRYFREALARSR